MTKSISEKICSGCFWLDKLFKTGEEICSIAQDEFQDFTIKKQCNEKVFTKEDAIWKIENMPNKNNGK